MHRGTLPCAKYSTDADSQTLQKQAKAGQPISSFHVCPREHPLLQEKQGCLLVRLTVPGKWQWLFMKINSFGERHSSTRKQPEGTKEGRVKWDLQR